jgi:uncharacterized protein YbaR (Trm112 family)/SAM-dependent methyltransferase
MKRKVLYIFHFRLKRMKYWLVEILKCPECDGKVHLKETFKEIKSPSKNDSVFVSATCHYHKPKTSFKDCKACKQKEVFEGVLECVCKRQYPVIKSIPRMLPDDLFHIIVEEYPSFFKSHKINLPEGTRTSETVGKDRTQENFGSKWKSFSKVDDEEYEQEFLEWVRPIPKEHFKGKLILEGGCGGMGNHLRYSQKFGGMVVGIDLSVGVDTSYVNTKHLANIYIVQGDLTRLPFKQVFDFGYSVGVLHHLPIPSKGLKNIVSRVKKGGKVAVWVYGKEGDFFRVYILMPAKVIITRLPHWMIKAMAWPLTFAFYPIAKMCLLTSKLFPKSKVLQNLPYYSYFVHRSRDSFVYQKALVYDHLVSPVDHHYSKEDMKVFLKGAGLKDIVLTPWKSVSWSGAGTVK